MNRSLLAALALPLLVACATPAPGERGAIAQLQPTPGHTAGGTVRFTPHAGKLRVSGEVRGLRPNAEHGFHVHEKGDCSGDGIAAGGHFNPAGAPHGHPAAGPHHAGDLPALRADAGGVARFSFETASLTLGGGPADVLGRGLIVHRDPDDYRTQPTGNSGARIACAVIIRS